MIHIKIPRHFFYALTSSALLLSTAVQAADISIDKNKDTGLLTWTSKDEGFSIELIQLIPDFVRAVFSKYDFTKSEIERIASYCVFGTILQNTSNQRLTYNVSDWTYTDKNGISLPVKSKSQWLEEWEKLGITYAWTLLPGSGSFEVGDWQQGFTTIKLPREASFDLTYTWTLDGKPHTGKLKNMSCPPNNLKQR